MLCDQDRGECMSLLCQAKDKIQETITALEGVGSTELCASISQGDDDNDPSNDGDKGPSQGPGSSLSKRHKGGNHTPGKHGNLAPNQGNNNGPTLSSSSRKGGQKIDKNYPHSGDSKVVHNKKVGHPFMNSQLSLSTPKSHTNRKVATMVKTPQTDPVPKTVDIQHKGSANKALSTSLAVDPSTFAGKKFQQSGKNWTNNWQTKSPHV